MIKQTSLNKACYTLELGPCFIKTLSCFVFRYVTKPELMANHLKPFPQKKKPQTKQKILFAV